MPMEMFGLLNRSSRQTQACASLKIMEEPLEYKYLQFRSQNCNTIFFKKIPLPSDLRRTWHP